MTAPSSTISIDYQTLNKPSLLASACDEAPLGGIAMIVLSVAAKIFTCPIAAPLFGIGLSSTLTRLVRKGIARYNNKLLISITKEVYKVGKKHPYLQIAAVILAFTLSFFCQPLSLAVGSLIGVYSALIFDVERAKLELVAKRKKNNTNV